jgi:peptide deformylase
MSILPIYNCFHPILKQKTQPITEITDEIKQLSEDMFNTLRKTSNGIGLAANQVGKAISMFVINISEVEEYENIPPFVCINPEIISYSDETNLYQEGCLSAPTFYEDVERPDSITIKFYDINMNEITESFTGFLARVVQHEYDHLQGILFYDRISAFKRTINRNKLKRLKMNEFEIDYTMIDAEGILINADLKK